MEVVFKASVRITVRPVVLLFMRVQGTLRRFQRELIFKGVDRRILDKVLVT